LSIDPKGSGTVVIQAESNGTDDGSPTPNTKITNPNANIYIIDSTCNPMTIPIWGTGNVILNSYIPLGLTGTIKILSVTSGNSNIAAVQYNGNTKTYTIKGKALGTVQMEIQVQYYNTDGSPSGLKKSLEGTVTVNSANIDIN